MHITETGGLRTLESAVWVDGMGGASRHDPRLVLIHTL